MTPEDRPFTEIPERPYNWRKVERPRQKRSGARYALLAALVLVILAAGGILYGEYAINASQSSSSSPFAFVVRNGDTDTSVANRLQSQGYIHSSLLFRIAARLQGLSGNLQPGTYTLRPNMSINQMVKVLATYNPQYQLVTIIPGYRARQIADILTSDGFNGRKFMQIVRHPHFRRGLPVGLHKPHGLEGFLFPDTYTFDRSASARDIVVEILKQFNREFTPTLRRAVRSQGKTIFNVVTMASIVQREAGTSAQDPLMASVYYNRLHDPAQFPFLQADPTVQYALGTPKNWWPVINVTPTTVKGRYNTYTHRGLPPGPISNPDLASLRAAVYPAKTQDYYFLSISGGRTLFEKTLAQHNADIRQYG